LARSLRDWESKSREASSQELAFFVFGEQISQRRAAQNVQRPAPMKPWLSTLLREPITHFLITGALIFVGYGWMGGRVDAESRTITLTEAQVAQMADGWKQVWQREPTAQELDGLIRDYIKEEIYAREAVRLGLDQDDLVIRRRLRSKMEYISIAAIEAEQPSDAILQQWLDARPGLYAAGARTSFDQVFAGEDQGRAKVLLAQLRSAPEKPVSGLPIPLPSSMEKAKQTEIARIFGEEFLTALAALPSQTWQGPVRSGFGLHLVRVRAVTSQSSVRLADVRQQVENDWRAATKAKREAEAYQVLLDAYTIRIEKPE
jgi:peptidyl-prolyl cis-trans isomerase C